MLNKIKSWLQAQALNGLKKQVIAGLEFLKNKATNGYTVSQGDIDRLFVFVKLPVAYGAFVAPFLVGLNLKNLVGSYDKKAIDEIIRLQFEVARWSL